MAATNTVNGRIALKHDTEANWKKATNFVPLKGEAIIYDVDTNYSYPRIKIGDGVSIPKNLPFVSNQDDINTIVSSSLSGLNSSDPTANGTSTTFIKTITQENGLIKATKATVATASTTAAGLMSATDKTKLDKISFADMAIYGSKITITKTDGTSTDSYINGIATAASGTTANAGRLQYTVAVSDTLTEGQIIAKRNIGGNQSPLWSLSNTDHSGNFKITWYKKEGGWAGQANLIHSKNYSTLIPAATTTAAGLMSSSDKTALSQLSTEIVPITRGGTGATSAIAARENLLIQVSASQPTSPTTGTIWFDIS